MSYAIGIDLGGTNVKLVAVTEAGGVLESASFETRDVPGGDWAARIQREVAALEERRGGRASWFGVATPGLPARDGRTVAALEGRLSGLVGLDWSSLFRTSATIRVLNDAQAALVGEAWKGAAVGYRNAVLLTLGTGVGGAILSDGRLLAGQVGRAGHFGHLCLDPEGAPPATTPVPGALENTICNGTVRARTNGRFSDTRELVAAHLAGDPEATAVWLRSVHRLACGISSIVNAADPEVVILGGGIAQAGPALFEPLARFLDDVEWRPFGSGVPIVAAALGEAAGALGAARAAMERGPAGDYLARARELLTTVESQREGIGRAADWFAESILAGRMVHVFGTGHSRMLVEEMWPRYGSFPGFNPIVELSLTFHNLVVGANGQRQAMFLENVPGLAERILRNFDLSSRDAALVASSSGSNRVSVEMAEGFRRRGIKVVAIVSQAHAVATPARHPSGTKLMDCADLVLDTGAPAGDALVEIAGLGTPVSPGSTVGGCLLVNAIKAEVAARLTAAGRPPTVLTSAALVGSERAQQLFEAAYDEHARRLACLYADLGRAPGPDR
jgi:predicted NBD/HSP70 family sugar kinase